MNHQAIKQTTRDLHLILVTASVLVISIGSSLFFFSERTDLLFSWTVNPPLTAAYLGAGYLAAFVLEYLASREKNWANARIAVPGMWSFTVVTLVVTLYHLDRFHFDSTTWITVAGTWVWLLVYILVPIALGFIWIRQIRRPGIDPARDNPLPGWLRYSALIQGMVLLISGTVMFLMPDKAIPFWPWSLSALTCRAIGAWGIGNGVFTIQAYIENDWERLRPFMPSWGLYGVLQLANVLIYNQTLNWEQTSAWIYLIFIIWITILGGYGTFARNLKS